MVRSLKGLIAGALLVAVVPVWELSSYVSERYFSSRPQAVQHSSSDYIWRRELRQTLQEYPSLEQINREYDKHMKDMAETEAKNDLFMMRLEERDKGSNISRGGINED